MKFIVQIYCAYCCPVVKQHIITTAIISSYQNNSVFIIDAPTAQKMKFSINDFFSKYDQIRRKLRIWSHLPMKSLMENFIFGAVTIIQSCSF